MKIITTIILCFLSFSFLAQNEIEGIVQDSETKTPIPYVNIGIVRKNIGTVSDGEGKFNLRYPSALANDTIKLSSLGYETKSISVKDFLSKLEISSTIELKPEIIALNEVVVVNKKLKEKNIGNRTKSKLFGNGFSDAPLGCEFGCQY